jgi:hypothetical protein
MLNLVSNNGNLLSNSINKLNTFNINPNERISIISVMGNQSSGKSLNDNFIFFILYLLFNFFFFCFYLFLLFIFVFIVVRFVVIGTILNLIFKTIFEVMERNGQKHRTTRGVWLSRANVEPQPGVPQLLIMDAEGLDGREAAGEGGV